MTLEQWIIAFETLLIIIGGGYIFNQYQQQKKLQGELNEVDELTGDLSRASMVILGDIVFEQARVRNSIFSVAMIDLDNFGDINDTFGFDVGDKVLTSVAQVLQQHKRQGDKISRWRGQGWLMLLPESSAGEATLIFERIQTALKEYDFSLTDKRNITVSMGVAELCSEDTCFDDIAKRADTVLFHAKQDGKNQLKVWQQEAESNGDITSSTT